MGKRAKSAKASHAAPATHTPTAPPPAVHPPIKRPALLALSVVLFALWLVFLLVLAIAG